ncbi:MAG: DUF4981 domain-containing protein [Lachnospiraceae bacterium]|nr:DUF4981 domain-containing protein [Lachnospiraceae bacterium]
MKTKNASLDWLCNPEIFQVNREPAHSDHNFTLYGQESRQYLNGTWKFSYASCPAERKKDFYQRDFDIEALDNIEVPGHIQLQGYGRPQYVNVMYPWDGQQKAQAPEVPMDVNPVGSYVKDIIFDKNIMSGKRQYISFQGVETAFYLYINGQFVGYAEDSFTPSEFDITEYITENVNRIGVEVYQRSSASWLEDQDFFRFSGIFRDVFVYAVPEAHIRDIFVHTSLSEEYKDCELKLDTKIDCHSEEKDFSASLVLKDKEGTSVISAENLALSELSEAAYLIEAAHLWSAENPYLYTLIITIKKQSDEIEKITQKIGMRKFEMKQGLMLINGKRIEFNGVNRHEFNCHKGRAVTKEDMLWDIRFMKQHNINAVRTCHYPDASLWYDLCDEYGIYMIGETNLETHGTWTIHGKDPLETCIPGNRPEWQEAVLDRANSMLQRDKNHPAILIWSCGNESFGGENIYKMSQLFREKDPSRLVHYEGIYHDRRYPDTSDMESQMYTRPWDIEEYLNNNPKKPFICCEYMHAMGNSCGGIKDYTDLLDKYPMYQGAFIWDYIDQALYKKLPDGSEVLCYGGDFDEVPDDGNFCGDGIVRADRQPYAKAAEVKFVYQQIKLEPDFQGVRIRNKRLFEDTKDLLLKIEVLKNGKVIKTLEKEIIVEPLSESYFKINLEDDIKEAGEYFVQAFLVLKQDTLWAEAGYELMSGRSEPKIVQEKEDLKDTKALSSSFMKNGIFVVNGDRNVGIHGKHFDITFSKGGGLISLQYKKKEMLAEKPKLCFYRASTDNDRGCNYMFDSGVWEFAERWQRCIAFEMQETEQEITLNYVYELPIAEGGMLVVNDKRENKRRKNNQTENEKKKDDKKKEEATAENQGNRRKGITVNVGYTITSNGRINVRLHYPGAQGLPELPLFGMQFVLKKEFNNFKYYGIGPWENYCDRNHGGKIGIFSGTAEKNMEGYLKPQSCGNRTETRWMETNDGQTTLRFSAGNGEKPFQFTVLPYNETELETAAHYENLPAVQYTYVKILPVHMGVGGDDSWGSQVRENCRIQSNQKIEYCFDMQMK